MAEYIELQSSEGQEGKELADEMARKAEEQKEARQRKYSGQYIQLMGEGKVKVVPREKLTEKQIEFIKKKAAEKRIPVKQVEVPWVSKYVNPKFGGRPTKTITLKEQIRLARMKNRIEKMKLTNALNRLKMNRRVEVLRRQGRIPELPYTFANGQRVMLPTRQPLTVGETHIEPSVNNDINTAFNADIGHGDTFWGGESYFLGNDYYGEDYFGEENMWTGLGLHGLNLGRGFRPPSSLLY